MNIKKGDIVQWKHKPELTGFVVKVEYVGRWSLYSQHHVWVKRNGSLFVTFVARVRVVRRRR
jgi:hypothetical protein